MEFVYIEPGSFYMGSTVGDSDEKPVHQVTITQGFYMGKYEVTQKQWVAIMGSNPSFTGYGIGDNYPVNYVTWNDIQTFVTKLNEKEGGTKYRLPTEAEWEYWSCYIKVEIVYPYILPVTI
ncbi:MAG: formylglycine-generating enzyme family protein, partial [Bacteroidetes bacterium]|nr:formylglycine-generating enzyme family protein [Bacteroidota bacterium]